MPRVRHKHSRIPEAEWEIHKSKIKKLYLEEKRNLENENGVIDLMEKHHKFRASKAQYEMRLRRWNFRKNLTMKGWQDISRICAKRKRQGKTSRFLLYGELIPDGKLQKEMVRNGAQEEWGLRADPSDEELPEGVTLDEGALDPSSIPTKSVAKDQALGLPTAFGREIVPRSSHSPILGANTNNLNPSQGSSWNAVFIERHITQDEARGNSTVTAMEITQTSTLSQSQTGSNIILTPEFSWINLTVAPFESQTPIFYSNSVSCHIAGFLEMVNSRLPQNMLSMVLALPIFKGDGFIRSMGNSVDPFTNSMTALLPFDARCDLIGRNPNAAYIVMTIYVLTNNFPDRALVEFEPFFSHLRNLSIPRAQALMDSIPSPYSIALEQSVLTVAITSGATSMVHTLLKRDLDVNRKICRDKDLPITPVALACRRQHIEMVRILMGFGPNGDTLNHALDDLINNTTEELWRSKSHTGLEILEVLLCSGADIYHVSLERPGLWAHNSFVVLFLKHAKTLLEPSLLLHILDDSLWDYGYGVHTLWNTLAGLVIPSLEAVIRYREDTQAIRILTLFLGQDLNLEKWEKHSKHANTGVTFVERCLLPLLNTAIASRRLAVLEFLLEAGALPSASSLALVVRGHSLDLVQRILCCGVKPNDFFDPYVDKALCQPTYSEAFPGIVEPLIKDVRMNYVPSTTPFAEAIKCQQKEIIETFAVQDALQQAAPSSDLICSQYDVAVLAALQVGDVEMVANLLEIHGIRTINSDRFFFFATLGNNHVLIGKLLDAGFRPSESSITAAIATQNTKILRLFLDVGVSLSHSEGLLWLAVRTKSIEVASLLLDAGAFTNRYAREAPFMPDFGMYAGSFARIKLELQNDAATTPLGEAFKNNHLAMVQLLFEKGARVDIPSNGARHTVLSIAAESGVELLVREVLARGADPNDPAALLAAARKSLSMVHLLLNAFREKYPGVKATVGNEALHFAVRQGNVEQVSLFAKFSTIDHFPEDKELGGLRRTPLGEAIISRDSKMILSLLLLGAEPDSIATFSFEPPERRTALLLACETQDLSIVQLIHGFGADINYPVGLGVLRTPLQLASELGCYDIVEYLLNHGAEVEGLPCVYGGGTALQLASIKGYVGIAELLVTLGASVDAKRGKYHGRTAFEGAAEHGRMDMLVFLCRKGVDLTSDGGEQVRRAIEFADKNGQLGAKMLVEQVYNLACSSINMLDFDYDTLGEQWDTGL